MFASIVKGKPNHEAGTRTVRAKLHAVGSNKAFRQKAPPPAKIAEPMRGHTGKSRICVVLLAAAG